VEHIASIADDAYGGLREEILGLRASVGEAQDIIGLLKEYLDRFHRQWGLDTRLNVHRLDDKTGPLHLDLSSEVQLLRIVQEGLTNVRRHANAGQVVIAIEEGNQSLRIVIQDDGQGFNPEQVAPDRLGLRIMQERVHSVGGELRISSQIGRGTVLETTFRKHGKA
jgi:signal transduction histidine kinase